MTFDVIKRLKNLDNPLDESEINDLYHACDIFKKKIGVFMRTSRILRALA